MRRYSLKGGCGFQKSTRRPFGSDRDSIRQLDHVLGRLLENPQQLLTADWEELRKRADAAADQRGKGRANLLHVVVMAGVHLFRFIANANANTNASHPSPPSRSIIHQVPILASFPAGDHLLWLPKRRDAEEPEPHASRRMEGNPPQPKLPSQFDHANGLSLGSHKSLREWLIG